MNLKVFKIAATPEAALEIEELRKKLGFQTYADLMEWSLGVGRAVMEAQEAGASVQIVYKRSWKTLWLKKEVYYLDVSPEAT